MDVYTTSFCLPHNPAHSDLEDPAPTFELPRDVAAAAAAQNAPGAQVPFMNNGQQPTSSNSSRGNSASGGEHLVHNSSSSSFGAGASNVAVGTTGSTGTTQGRRSTSSITSFSQATGSSSSSIADISSTAPSSMAGSHFGKASSTVGPSSNATTPAAGASRQLPDGLDHTASAAANAAAAQHRTSSETTEQMQTLCMEAMSNYQCMVTSSPLEGGKGYNFHLSGGYQQVMGARGYILRGSPFKVRRYTSSITDLLKATADTLITYSPFMYPQKKSVVKVPRSEVLDAKENVKSEMRRKLDEIAALTKAHLAIVGQVSGTIGFGLETERNVEIVITGSYESIEQARVRLLVLLDELVSTYRDID